MNNSLYDLILKCQYGNKDSLMYLIEKFKPLIRKYAKKLNYDGSDSDLIITLIYIIKSMPIKTNITLKKDKCIIGYISNSIRYKYIALSKKYHSTIPDLELKEEIIATENINNIEDVLLINTYLDKLSDLQKYVLKQIYFKDISERSIAKNLNISRQAVNKTKIRALKNLKRYLS